MVRSSMTTKRDRPRRPSAAWLWTSAGLLTVSIIVNLGLIAKIVVLDPNVRFKPICFTQDDGLVVLDGPLSKDFRDQMVLSDGSVRAGEPATVYVSRWDLWKYKGGYWNMTRSIAVHVYQKRTGKRLSMEARARLRTSSCGFIRKYALD